MSSLSILERPAARPAPGRACRPTRAELRLVPGRASRAIYWRRRAAVLLVVVLLGLLLTAAIGQARASADLADRVDGHVVVEPGQTLWDIAVLTAPDGVDHRAQLADIEQLNGVRASEVDAWNVVLLPAR